MSNLIQEIDDDLMGIPGDSVEIFVRTTTGDYRLGIRYSNDDAQPVIESWTGLTELPCLPESVMNGRMEELEAALSDEKVAHRETWEMFKEAKNRIANLETENTRQVGMINQARSERDELRQDLAIQSNLVLLIHRLVHQIRSSDLPNDLTDKALGYLERKNLRVSVTRASGE